jgi:ABC-2 type transport system ATP-binding protein
MGTACRDSRSAAFQARYSLEAAASGAFGGSVVEALQQTVGVLPERERSVAVEVDHVSRRFGSTQALDDVSMQVREGEIHALLGPNGAGKTTLLRSLTGLVDPGTGTISLLGTPLDRLGYRARRRLFGLVPSGDRSFYLRISGLENLVFFARLYGFRRTQAFRRAWQSLEDVGLTEAAHKMVGHYSHGMQKRLSVARGLLPDPIVLFVDEATHDLDPEGSRRVQELVTAAAARGTAVIWATQRLDEIRDFAHRVTVLDRGRVRFVGTVPQLMAMSVARRYVLQLHTSTLDSPALQSASRLALGSTASLRPIDDADGSNWLLELNDGAVLGDAIAALAGRGIPVLACREERSGIENAFLFLTGGEQG